MIGAHTERRRLVMGLASLIAQPAAAAVPGGSVRVTIGTDHGAIEIELHTARAPLTCANFLRYVDAAKYDGGAFSRATGARNDGGHGTIVAAPPPGSHPYPPIAHESTRATGLRHVAGTVSLGRFAPGTATSNFFICLGPAPSFDARPGAAGDNLGFAAFARVVGGMAVVRRIHALRRDGPSPYPDQKGEWLNPPAALVRVRRAA